MLKSNQYKDKHDFESILIERVGKYIENLISHYININKLQSIYICVDGVPTMAKIHEQKKRRYMGDILSFLTPIHKPEFTWSKNNISPGTEFMGNMIEYLKSNLFVDRIKKTCPNKIKYIVSGVDESGEGEFKIVQIIDKLPRFARIMREDSYSSHITVYSPDSDVILLLLLSAIKNPTFKITMLRHNQQESTEDNMVYEDININKFQNVLINYITSKVRELDSQKEINNNNIIADIVFILTIFGDDFLPKLETVRISMDISIILDFYTIILNRYDYILKKKDGVTNSFYNVNTNSFIEFLKIIRVQEDYFIKRNAKHHMYRSYHKIDTLILGDSLYKIRDLAINYIWKFIYLNKVPDVMISPINVSTIIPTEKFIEYMNKKEVNIDKNILNKFINMNNNSNGIYDCYNMMLTLIKYNFIEVIQNITLYNSTLSITPEYILQTILIYFYQNYKLPFDIGIMKYDEKLHINTFKSTDIFHKKRLKYRGNKESMSMGHVGAHNNNYIIENKLDEYYNILNPVDMFYKKYISTYQYS